MRKNKRNEDVIEIAENTAMEDALTSTENVEDASTEEYPYIIEMCNITKEFPGIIANDDITLQLKKGEIHALLGENGAGKSTLMSVLFGLYQPEKGEIKRTAKLSKSMTPTMQTNWASAWCTNTSSWLTCLQSLTTSFLVSSQTQQASSKRKMPKRKSSNSLKSMASTLIQTNLLKT
jgi:ABC-type sugar transport system ATPase subunit